MSEGFMFAKAVHEWRRDSVSAKVDHAYLLDTKIKADSKVLTELKVALRNFSDEIGERKLTGNNAVAQLTEGTETRRLNTKRVVYVLEKLHAKGAVSRRMLNSCFDTSTPATKVTLKKLTAK